MKYIDILMLSFWLCSYLLFSILCSFISVYTVKLYVANTQLICY